MDSKPFQGKATITSMIMNAKRRLNYTFEDKTELVEEYDIKTHELITRKYKKLSTIKEASWVQEVGE